MTEENKSQDRSKRIDEWEEQKGFYNFRLYATLLF